MDFLREVAMHYTSSWSAAMVMNKLEVEDSFLLDRSVWFCGK